MSAPRFSSPASRKPYRFSQTASPDELLPLEAQQAIVAVWSLRARYWQRRPDQPPCWRWGRESETFEPESVGIRCPTHILRELRIASFLQLLNMELERGLRLLLELAKLPGGLADAPARAMPWKSSFAGLARHPSNRDRTCPDTGIH